MKTKLLIIILTLFTGALFAQNIFPSSGNVGIGTSNPVNKLQVGVGTAGYSGNDLLISNANGSLAIHNDISHTYLFGNRDIAIRPGGGYMAIYANSVGNVGIGTIAPAFKLDVAGGVNTTNLTINPTANSNAQIYFKNQGSLDWDLGTQVGEATQNFNLYNRGTSAIALSINKISNNVGIGTTSPDFKLTVNGKIKAEEIQVVVDVPADYVFEKDYTLMPLEEVERFVNENKHLPQMPNAQHLIKNGWQVGEMNNKLLEKVEELTLYLIEIKKELDQVKKENKELKRMIQKD